MGRLFSIAGLVLLTGCANMPVSSLSLCMGICTYHNKIGQPQTTAEKAGALAGDLLGQFAAKKWGKK